MADKKFDKTMEIEIPNARHNGLRRAPKDYSLATEKSDDEIIISDKGSARILPKDRQPIDIPEQSNVSLDNLLTAGPVGIDKGTAADRASGTVTRLKPFILTSILYSITIAAIMYSVGQWQHIEIKWWIYVIVFFGFSAWRVEKHSEKINKLDYDHSPAGVERYRLEVGKLIYLGRLEVEQKLRLGFLKETLGIDNDDDDGDEQDIFFKLVVLVWVIAASALVFLMADSFMSK